MWTSPSSAQPQPWRLLFVGGNKAIVRGSQSRAEELEALSPVAGPAGALVGSPISKAEFKTLVFECVVLQTVSLVTAPQIEMSFVSLSLSAASHLC